jgi:hypothetical protein
MYMYLYICTVNDEISEYHLISEYQLVILDIRISSYLISEYQLVILDIRISIVILDIRISVSYS